MQATPSDTNLLSRLTDRVRGQLIRPRHTANDIRLSEEQLLVFRRMEESSTHLFITGKAGTGKSVLLRYFASKTRKRIVTVAPTGLAALAIDGQTIHSLFKLPVGLIALDKLHVHAETAHILRHIDAVVIDEISMVRADVIDAINKTLQLARHTDLPFGGVQIIAFGDAYQLPPVVEDATLYHYFRNVYSSAHFFSALVWKATTLEIQQLTQVFRQTDEQFRSLLDRVREGAILPEDIRLLRTRTTDTRQLPQESAITLTTTNAAANTVNRRKLEALHGRTRAYHADTTGTVSPAVFPADNHLHLKVGAQVLLTKNDPEGRWVNGTIGTIRSCSRETVVVQCGRRAYEVIPVTWNQYRYRFNPKRRTIEQELVGTFTQLPIKLAWAITIHKSQGATYDTVIVDLRSGAFAHGQVYVALSRCKSLSGLYLLGGINAQDIAPDPFVTRFMSPTP